VTDFWARKRVIVTGGAGYLGRHVVRRLEATGATVCVPRSADYDMRTPGDNALLHSDFHDTDILFHLAATVGGIGANMRRPADFLHDNMLMSVLVPEYARRAEVGKVVLAGSVCAYPCFCPVPFREENLWAGYPEETNAPYGVAKRVLWTYAKALRQQYGVIAIYLIPTNLYGPGDHDDLVTSHVIPALIRKIDTAKRTGSPLVVWGTGRATRDFLYVDDCADALMEAAQWYSGTEPVNLGSGEEVGIAALVGLLCDIMDWHGEVIWDKTKPDGQPRRVLDTSRAWDMFQWRATTPLREGLQHTVIDWLARNADPVAPAPVRETRPGLTLQGEVG